MNKNPTRKVYTVLVDDIFHNMDPDERYEHGSYSLLKEALHEAKMVVNRFLEGAYEPDMTADELFEKYAIFGLDPFIQSNTKDKFTFSAWGYAKERCEEICDPHRARINHLKPPYGVNLH